MKEIVEQLNAVFPANDHLVREGGYGSWFVYIKRDAIIDRLNTVAPMEWTNFITDKVRHDHTVTVTMEMAVKGITRSFNGSAEDKPIKDKKTKEIIGWNSENTEKAAATDAFKRVASMFGIGLYLQQSPRIKASSEDKALNQFFGWYNSNYNNKKQPEKQPSKRESPLQNKAPRRVGDVGMKKEWGIGVLERFIESIQLRYPGIKTTDICELYEIDDLTGLGTPQDAWYSVMKFAYDNNQPIRMTHMRYHIQKLKNRTDKRLEFTAYDAQGNISKPIYAYGRSGVFKAKIGVDVYDTFGFARYGDDKAKIKHPTETTKWVEMEEAAIITYETEITSGDEEHTYYTCTSFVPESIWQDQQEDF
jgi:hypothetical protein